MLLSSLVFRQAATSSGFKFRFWNLLRKGILWLSPDPICRMLVHGRMININLSHDLPLYQAQHPFYDTLPARLANFLRSSKGQLIGIDVGANIGDSLLAFVSESKDRFLAIEPNPKFFDILKSNWQDDIRVVPLSVLCSASDELANVNILEKRGTASVVKTNSGNGMQHRTINSLASEYSFLDECNLIKIDTDGHDFEVLDGAMAFIARTRPAVLFECDVFGREDYTEKISSSFQNFERLGYSGFLLYDNFGYLMGRFRFDQIQNFFHLVFYQLSGKFHYFDILVLPNNYIEDFHRNEVNFFIGTGVDSNLGRTALAAALR